MMGVLDGKVVLITGAAGGIGKECALLAAREGARLVVNDLGGSVAGGDEGSAGPAEETAAEIRALGGEAVANSESVTSLDSVKGMVAQAIKTFGALHAVINPAGILRDGMFHKMSEADWDAGDRRAPARRLQRFSRGSVEHFRDQEDGVLRPLHLDLRADRQHWPGELRRRQAGSDGAVADHRHGRGAEERSVPT